MRSSTTLLLLLGFPVACAVSQSPPHSPAPLPKVDLTIGDDETYKRPVSWSYAEPKALPNEILLADEGVGAASRPGVSIAWRNAAQIEEVEVKVRNLGTEPAEGRVFVDITDETGRQLLHLDAPEDQTPVRLAAVDRGGLEGKIVRMRASRELNNLIDRYDRERRRYDVTATIEASGADDNPGNNSKTKSYNIPFRVVPGTINTYPYVFTNHTDHPLRVMWRSEHTPFPTGWSLQGVPAVSQPFEIRPGNSLSGTLMMAAPSKIEEGAFLETRLSLVDVDAKSGRVLAQREWFQVYDTVPPEVSNYKIVFSPDHRIGIQALVADKGSGVLEATGVQTEYSADGGKTWSTKAHNYSRGNFVNPTVFEVTLGPFAPGTHLDLRFSARDTAGNVQARIPDDASAMEVQPGSEKLLDRNGTPNGQTNPIFDFVPPQTKEVKLSRIVAPADELLHITTLSVEAR